MEGIFVRSVIFQTEVESVSCFCHRLEIGIYKRHNIFVAVLASIYNDVGRCLKFLDAMFSLGCYEHRDMWGHSLSFRCKLIACGIVLPEPLAVQ